MNRPTKLLVANRAEIACRVFQTCREMGIKTVGILAPGDEEARHLTYADEICEVPAYLDSVAIIAQAKRLGAKLVHPGYGFLSERPAFAAAVEAAGLTFLGPRADSMSLLGEKIAAKRAAEQAAVPTLPWAIVEAGQNLKAAALKVGFPLLLKASAGGGGKGMRKVLELKELEDAAESASAEAQAAFGDGTLFLEKLLLQPRHVEVQVFGDGKGGGVHLHERECSLQRRHQKVWEEAPAAQISETTRNALHEAALSLLRAVKYRSAGTVEFLVDDAGGFYFLEMNTRLQVEHPVTEWVTGTDLVRAQIELGLNGNSPWTEPPSVRGHSIEVRLYAEDPARGFMPWSGKVEALRWPLGAGIRVDSGIEVGQTIHTQYDAMLAKLSVYGSDRASALARVQEALRETVIAGVGTNQPYLLAISEHPQVQAGRVSTSFLEEAFASFQPEFDAVSLELLAHSSPSSLGGSGAQGSPQNFPSPWVSP